MSGEPKTPVAWANFLVRAWGPRFPVDVRTIALDYSKRFSDPIRKIVKAEVETFEGAIYFRPKQSGWVVLYNPLITSRGRINFTLGHELGHYLSHRQMIRAGSGFLECSQGTVLGVGDEATNQIEQEADAFASYLLMPMDDYRRQIDGQTMTLDLLNHCAGRYGVSATAAARKWIEFTTERAVLVVARDGFVSWSRSSQSAFKSYVFFRSGTPLPAESVAARPGSLDAHSAAEGVELPPDVWVRDEPVREVTLFADSYDMTISLLLLPKERHSRPSLPDDEEHEPDLVDRWVG